MAAREKICDFNWAELEYASVGEDCSSIFSAIILIDLLVWKSSDDDDDDDDDIRENPVEAEW